MKESLDEDQRSADEKECEHEWEAVGEKHSGTHLEMKCKKCGEKKEVALFP